LREYNGTNEGTSRDAMIIGESGQNEVAGERFCENGRVTFESRDTPLVIHWNMVADRTWG